MNRINRITLWVILILVFAVIIGVLVTQSSQRRENINIDNTMYHLTL